MKYPQRMAGKRKQKEKKKSICTLNVKIGKVIMSIIKKQHGSFI